MDAYRRLWIDKTGEAVVTTTTNGAQNATRWGWTEAKAVPIDAIVLEGPLPKVSRDKGRYVVEGDPGRYYLSADDTPASLRESARPQAARLFALAKYLEEHPPVDEAQVQAVAEALAAEDGAASGDWPDYRPRARRLVERGVRVGGDSDD